MGFFDSLGPDKTAVLMHRDKETGLPNGITVPNDFSPRDIHGCLQSFGFSAELEEAEDYEDPTLGNYVFVPLRNVKESLPTQLPTATVVAQGARRVVKQKIEGFTAMLKGIADKL